MRRGRQSGDIVFLKPEISTGRMVGYIIRIAILIVGIIIFFWSQNNLVVQNTYIYESPRVPKSFVGYHIVHISDLHNTGLGVVGKVKGCGPDLILVTGGYADDKGRADRSAKILQQLAQVAPTYYVLGDGDSATFPDLVGAGPQLIEDGVADIQAPEVDIDKFISKYVKKKIRTSADQGDEVSTAYIDYIKDELTNGVKTLRIFGIPYGADTLSLNTRIYSLIGTEREYLTLALANQTELFGEISKADVDVVLSGGTHGKDNGSGFKSGVYSNKGTDMFLSRGIGNVKETGSRFLNYPQVSLIVLSDGTIKDENPIEKILGNLIYDVDTIFENDKGFTEKYYEFNQDEYTPYRKT